MMIPMPAADSRAATQQDYSNNLTATPAGPPIQVSPIMERMVSIHMETDSIHATISQLENRLQMLMGGAQELNDPRAPTPNTCDFHSALTGHNTKLCEATVRLQSILSRLCI